MEYRASWTASLTGTLLTAATGGRWLEQEVGETFATVEEAVEAVGGEKVEGSYVLRDIRFDTEERFESYKELDMFLLDHSASDYEVAEAEQCYAVGDAELRMEYDPLAPEAFGARLDGDATVRDTLEEELETTFYRTGWRRLLDVGRRWRP